MALRAVLDHPKFTRLTKLLGVPRYMALGCLETLWHFTGRYTPQGNIGKYADADIEAWCGWDGPEGAMLSTLLEAGWLDLDNGQGYVVHDWSEYADETVHTELARKCMMFCDGTLPKSGRLNQDERARYTQWLASEGRERRATGRPVTHERSSHNAAESQPKGSEGLTQPPAERQRKSAENPKPVPVPEPVPVPVPVPGPGPEPGPVPGPEPEPGAEPEPLRSAAGELHRQLTGASPPVAAGGGTARAPTASSRLPREVLEEIGRPEYSVTREVSHGDNGASNVDQRTTRPTRTTETRTATRR